MVEIRPIQRNQKAVVAGLERAMSAATRPNFLVVLWRWRYEAGLLLMAGVGIGLATPALAVLAVTIAILLLGWKPAREFLRARAACVVIPHRVRAACVQARIHSRRGRLPFILLTRATPTGERVLVWCRAGVSPADFVAARQLIATACWAADVRVNVNRHHIQLITLEIVRVVE